MSFCRFLVSISFLLMAMPLMQAQQSGTTKQQEVRFYSDGDTVYPLWRLFYNDDFSGTLVKLHALSMDSLPDEVNIRLIRDTSEFCFPMKNIITSPYGWRERWNRPHRGVDILLRTGDPIHCCFPGVVRIARSMGGYGNVVVVRHPNGLETVYGHMSKILVKPRQILKAGDIVGLGGSTGRSTGPHLHFEVRFQYEPFDPEWILDFKNYTLRTRKLHLDKTYFGISPPKGRKHLEYKADKSIIKEKPSRREAQDIYYTVTADDTWSLIALKMSTTVGQLKEMNPSVKKLKTGVRLKVR